MNEAYSVAVRISLVETVTRGLAMMSRHFKTTDADAAALEARLKSIGKMTLVGGALMGAGFAGLSLFKKPIEESLEWERRLASLRQMGIGDAQIADARKFVTATQIIGESMNDRMRLFVDAQGSFRQSGMGGAQALTAAKTMMPILGTYEAATKMLSGDKRDNAEMAMRSLNKTIEIMGGLGDAKRAQAIAEGVFKASRSSGGMVDERQLKQFVAYGSSATNQLNLRTIFGGLEPLIGELGGSTAAVGLRTAYTRTNGMMSLPPKRMVAEMGRLGMLQAGTKQQSDSLARLQATQVIDYAQQIMQMYAAHGITSRTDTERENAIIFGTNGSKIYNKIMSQMPVIQQSLKAYDTSQGPGAALSDPRNKMLKAYMDLQAKESDLYTQIGLVVLPAYVKMLEKMRDVLKAISDWASANPAPFKAVVAGLAGLAIAAIVGGGLTLLTAGIKGLGLVMIPVNVGMQILTSRIRLSMLPAIATAGLALAGIAIVGLLIYNNWKEIKTSGMKIWDEIKAGFIKLFHGDILGAMWSFSAAMIRGWQTIFNTIIAGLDQLLPNSMQIGKMHFADDFEAWLKSKNSVGAGKGGGDLHVNVHADGKPIAKVVIPHIVKAMSRPNAGTLTHNAAMSPPWPGGR